MAKKQSLFSRRNMIVGLAGTATVGTIAATQKFSGTESFADLLRPAGLGRHGATLATANVEDWKLQVGSYFTAHTGQVLKLVDVQGFKEANARPGGLRTSAFVARFDVARGGAMAGAEVYRLAHPEGGTLDLFMTAADAAKPLRMLAVMN